jgi:hypothetical protein
MLNFSSSVGRHFARTRATIFFVLSLVLLLVGIGITVCGVYTPLRYLCSIGRDDEGRAEQSDFVRPVGRRLLGGCAALFAFHLLRDDED